MIQTDNYATALAFAHAQGTRVIAIHTFNPNAESGKKMRGRLYLVPENSDHVAMIAIEGFNFKTQVLLHESIKA